MKVGLVLGGGGMVGLSYHAGVLRALEVEAGFRPDSADLIVGTSAGAVVGAYLRSGWTTDDFWQLALGTHPSMKGIGRDDASGSAPEIFVASWRTPIDLYRRAVGSAFVLGRSFVRWPVPPLPIPSILAKAFPGGMFDMVEGRRRFDQELPEAWPDRPLWLCALDLGSGRRVVLGRPGSGAPEATLRQAVLASAAIPGIYRPVRVGGRVLVDGGAWSSTNLDLAVKAECSMIIGVAPMAFDPERAPTRLLQLVRRLPARSLSAEVAGARGAGAQVLLVRPDDAELRLHGLNLMRPDGLDRIAKAAYEATARALATERFRSFLHHLAA
ncbi:MAG TPA: patatin-like phospholipase family protein [Acidimicrobiales bacterium]|nr:patatin-like phospholipase family protein [Acidimicrobiales bacterium]